MLHHGTDVCPQIYKRLFPAQRYGIALRILGRIHPHRRLLVPDQNMAVHLHPFRQHLIDHRIRCGKGKLALRILQRIRLHRIARCGNIVMHFQQLQPHSFQILGRNGIPDQKIILVRSLQRNQILLDGYRTGACMFKADIVNVKDAVALFELST